MDIRWLVFALVATVGCGSGSESSGSTYSYSGPPPAFSQTDLVVGTGSQVRVDERLTVHYTGWLYDPTKPDNKGPQFDSSVGGEPMNFKLGAGRVIPGWDRGFGDMRVGGKRRLVVPPDLAYGSDGTPGGPIPPNAPLVFELELLDAR